MRSKSRSFLLAAVAAAGLLTTGLAVAGPAGGARASDTRTVAGRVTGAAARNPFCAGLGVRYQASAGAQGFCFGPQPTVGGQSVGKPTSRAWTDGRNVDAAAIGEDVNHGVRGNGQSETSIAAAGNFVVEAWNDSTAFFSTCLSIKNKAEITGLGFSADGGKHFTDLGGLPNASCRSNLYEGDPSVASYQASGKTWFYISSLYDSPTGVGVSEIAMDVCQASGTTLSCDAHPVIIANSNFCQPGGRICDFLDKDFITIDPATHRLYATYTDFPSNSNSATTSIDATMCSLANPAKPMCEVNAPGKPSYETLAKAGTSPCEREGAYPAVDAKTGDLYVGYEFNWFSSNTLVACTSHANRVQEILDRVPRSCLTQTTIAHCGVGQVARIPITSMENAPPPGYSRFIINDFPRIAVSNPYGTVSMVWNDSTVNPLGSILLQSFHLGSLKPVQSQPANLSGPGPQVYSNFMPALRNANSKGLLDVAWYNDLWSQGVQPTPHTNVLGMTVSPLFTGVASSSGYVSDFGTDWTKTVSDINPNFGDYIDSYVSGSTWYVAWSDGRFGIPQPFEAHIPA